MLRKFFNVFNVFDTYGFIAFLLYVIFWGSVISAFTVSEDLMNYSIAIAIVSYFLGAVTYLIFEFNPKLFGNNLYENLLPLHQVFITFITWPLVFSAAYAIAIYTWLDET